MRLITFRVLPRSQNLCQPQSAPLRTPFYRDGVRSHSWKVAELGLRPRHPAPVPALVTGMPHCPWDTGELYTERVLCARPLPGAVEEVPKPPPPASPPPPTCWEVPGETAGGGQ